MRRVLIVGIALKFFCYVTSDLQY